MRELQREFNTSVLLITHDMGVVAEMADDVVVMNQGRIEERAPAAQLFHAPRAAYIRGLLALVERNCHRVAVLFGGRIVEIGPRDRVLHHPRHPYTRRLLSAVPMPDVNQKRDFHSLLADMATSDPIKPHGWQSPPQQFIDYGNGHLAAC